jgi:DNA-directed RNA polymerase subunit RPC12/RpoP
MRCSQCAATSFSAAAKTLVERGDRCQHCGGELTLAERRQPVAVAVAQRVDGDDTSDRERRFGRD